MREPDLCLHDDECYEEAIYCQKHYDALAALLAEAERGRDEWHARAIALFWKGDADGATVGHVQSATAAIKQLLAADSADEVQK